MRLKFILIIFILPAFTFCQTEVKSLLDSLIARTKRTSLYASEVNWDSLQNQVYLKAKDAKTIYDLKPAFTTLLNGIKDHHGRIINAKDYSTLANFTDYESLNNPDKRPRKNEFWYAVNDTSNHFEYKLLKGNVGYLKIVAIPPNVDIEKEAKKIRAAVIEFAKLKVKNWIIDLRYNGGGNMNPMVEGIAPLIGDGIVGSLVDLKGNKQFDWEIKASNFIYFNVQAINLPNDPVFKEQPKVAVLQSRYTVSSGEVVATCFKGRPHTKFFGEASGSYTTNNNWEVIDDKVILNISTGVYCDRNKNIFKYNIPVDVEVPFEITGNTESDLAVIEAKKWLLESDKTK